MSFPSFLAPIISHGLLEISEWLPISSVEFEHKSFVAIDAEISWIDQSLLVNFECHFLLLQCFMLGPPISMQIQLFMPELNILKWIFLFFNAWQISCKERSTCAFYLWQKIILQMLWPPAYPLLICFVLRHDNWQVEAFVPYELMYYKLLICYDRIVVFYHI